jgi:hypothetical protein
MNMKSAPAKPFPLPSLPARLVLALCGLLLIRGAGEAAAAVTNHYVLGQVFEIASRAAADPSIPAANLTGSPFPYVWVRVYDQASGNLLGETFSGSNGQFTVGFAAAGSPSIECRVYRGLDGAATLLPAARPGMNTFPAAGPFLITALRVVSDERVQYGDAGFRSYPGVGLVFTQVGNVEIPFISQDTTLAHRPVAGLADFTHDPDNRAGELHVPAFVQAPFAGGLLIFGDFGEPGGACAGSSIDWYRVWIKKVSETAPDPPSYESQLLLLDPLSKIRTEVTTFPTVSVRNTTQILGPLNGTLEIATSPINGLYAVNRNQVGGAVNTFYSFPDLRMNWVSSGANGLYEISLEYFQETGRTADNRPIVHQLPASCFVGSVPSAAAAGVALQKLILRVDNHDLRVQFDHIFLRNRFTGRYAAATGPDVTTIVGALDFNADGLCDILHLGNHYEPEIRFTARHEGGYMGSYSLAAGSNDGSVSVSFVPTESFTAHTTSTNPLWEGTPPTGQIVRHGGFTKACAYLFALSASSRLQNGYGYVQSSAPGRAYYVTPN